MSPQEHLKTAIYGPFHHHVLSGPFNGMRYVDYSVGSSLYPKLLGTYEKELQQWLEAQRTNSNLNTIVNIGSGEGYYAVGAAMWLPGAKAFAFDTNALAQSTCLQLAHLNGVVERLYMYGEASGALVNPLLTETSLLIVDIEGAEYDLISSLDQDRLKSTRLMIELHDFVSMEETDRLLTSLRSTHTVELAYSQQRTPKDFDDSLRVGLAERDPAQLDQFLSSIPDGLKMQWLDEQRPGQMRWALCTPIPAKSQRARTTTSKSKSSLTRVQLAGNSESIITGCILAQNEEKRIEGAIRCLLPWVSEVLVIDDSSTDCTAEIAASLGARVISAASETNFDGARNLAKEYATTEYIFFLDADERVHPALAAILTQLVTHREGDFDALIIPFKNYFCGKWIEHCGWWPGYTRPQLLKREKFTYRSRLHSGVEVDGKTLSFPSHQHELAISHFSYDDLDAYVTKMNRYTCGEADNLDLDNLSHHWKAQIAHFMVDWQWYYDLKEAPKDGTHGFVLAFMAACYRFISRAKLWDKRRKDGLDTGSDEVPSSMAEILSFMREIAINGPGEWLQITTLPTEAVIATASSLSDAPVFAKKSGKTSAKMPTVTGCILAKNEESQIADAILSLTGWCKEVIVLDNESTDRTAEISKSLGAKVISVPVSDDFDGLRNMVVEHASGEWIYYLDADERVPASLVPVIKDFLKTDSSDYVAAKFPFRTKIFGKWMESPVRWPGYSREQLLKKGSFHYNHLLHGVIQVDGEVKKFEAESVDQAVVHYAFDDITHYISKANGYTSREGSIQVSLDRPHTWDVQLTVFVREWNLHYDTLQAYQDGMHGFVFSFLSAFYRYLTVAKPWDHRRKLGYIDDATNMPTTVLDMVNFMARAIGIEFGHSPIQPAPQNHVPELASSRGSTNVKNIVVVGPALASGEFGDDCRDICTSLTLLDPAFGLIAVPWNTGNIELGSSNQFALESNVVAPNQLAGIAVVDLPILQQRHLSTAEITIARTWFETDRLDSSAVELLSQVDRIWVASKFNLNTFANSGVPQAKIAVIPPTIEPEYLRTPDVTSAIRNGPFRFISFVDWGLYKGWDILVDAFVTAFKSTSDIELKIVILDLDGSTLQSAEAEIDVHLRRNYSKGLIDCENIKLECAGRSHTAREAQLTDADAYIQPSRGEGSCRDLLRAMAVGLPVVSPAWGAFEDILNSDVGYPLNFELIPVDNELASKYPHFEGHNCIKPDTKHLQSIMRILSKRPASAQQKVRRAQKLVVERFSRQAVLPFIEAEIALCQQLRSAKKPVVPHDPPIASKPEIVVHDALLVQSATGDHTRLLDITRQRHEQYAKLHNMDYVCQYGPQQSERPAMWDKIPVLIDLLKRRKYKYIFWMDADTLIVDMGRDMRSSAPESSWLGMVTHGNPPYYNNGVMHVKNCPQALVFLEAVWNHYPVASAWEDNEAVIKVLEQNPALRSGVTIISDDWNSTVGQNQSPQPVVVAWHGFGSAEARRNSMVQAFSITQSHISNQVAELTKAKASSNDKSSKTKIESGPPQRPPSNMVQLDPVREVDLTTHFGRPLRVLWEGDQTLLSSLAHVNREICLRLLDCKDIELSFSERKIPWHTLTSTDHPRFAHLFGRIGAPLSGPPDVIVRHRFPSDWSRPEHGKLVVMQPWEWSHLPGMDWIEGATNSADQVWANTRFVRNVYVRSGVPAEKVHLIPEGVRLDVFSPEGPKYPIPTTKRTRFLFVGGALQRKGADLLLNAYLRAFTASDDVSLIVKDMGTSTFY